MAAVRIAEAVSAAIAVAEEAQVPSVWAVVVWKQVAMAKWAMVEA